jgi:hypothetical protein
MKVAPRWAPRLDTVLFGVEDAQHANGKVEIWGLTNGLAADSLSETGKMDSMEPSGTIS